ncbi:hypothetical protein DAPPUDRAFT_264320 [Daphnia pulex]|uniref:Transposable element P transposase-like GTP-binding insertion domain-containing protein n=1 Tax=Daphnia pulex TaxID=6669 RepID=E9HRC1_DAPPU|nr:hypothetical protein DAPPUDRAFT_264320 [Daphnia pulex]|eukprot:EFX65675.1 hypothetical protein DAPPUDRAFT_264320 [Daphnia pulex]
MNVKLAVQVLSNSVADCLRRYRLAKNMDLATQFKDSEALEDLLRLLNAYFDVMNSRRPIDGITQSNWNGPDGRRDVLSRLFKCLDDTNAACGELPMNEMEDEVLLEHSDDFRKDSQDGKPSEKIPIQVTQQSAFFGIIRMAGRCGDKPTVASFLELFRLLTMYYTTKQEKGKKVVSPVPPSGQVPEALTTEHTKRF